MASTFYIWEKTKVKIQRGRPNTSIDSGWLIPPELDLGPWKEFQKNATNDELLVTIWSKILNYSEDIISVGLGLTSGTIRYRCARGFRKLGSMTTMFAKKLG